MRVITLHHLNAHARRHFGITSIHAKHEAMVGAVRNINEVHLAVEFTFRDHWNLLRYIIAMLQVERQGKALHEGALDADERTARVAWSSWEHA